MIRLLFCCISIFLSMSLMAESDKEANQLNIYSATDLRAMAPILADYQQRNPGIRLNYYEFDTLELYEAIKILPMDKQPDIIISSSMDLQVRLVNDGYAQPLDSATSQSLPSWANWRNEAIGFTYEPIVFVYNKAAFENKNIPKTHEALALSLREGDEFYIHKVGSYDVRRSALGYLIATQDEVTSSISGRIQESLGRTITQVYGRTSQLLDDIANGKLVLGYNMLGSYSLARAKRDPRIGVVIPEDYTLVVSRVGLISKAAKHVVNAKNFMSYLISPEGQQVMAEQSELIPLNPKIDPLVNQLGDIKKSINFHPIPLGPALMVYLDQSKKRRFIDAWETALLPKQQ